MEKTVRGGMSMGDMSDIAWGTQSVPSPTKADLEEVGFGF
jgi:hypothetical protein